MTPEPLTPLEADDTTEALLARTYRDEWLRETPLRYQGGLKGLVEAIPALKQRAVSVREWAETVEPRAMKGTTLFLWGLNGTGKSGLAYGALEILMGRGWTAYAEDMKDMNAKIKATYGNTSGSSEHEITEKAKRRDIFLLDDFALGDMTANLVGILRQIFSHRYNYLLPTIITSNLSPSQLSAALHQPANLTAGRTQADKTALAYEAESIISRLAEMVGGNSMHIEGADNRRAK